MRSRAASGSGSLSVAASATRRTELVGNGARQYLVIERYDRAVDGETVTLIHQEDAAQALGLDTRIGLEDTLTLPDGTVASSNADLVCAAAR